VHPIGSERFECLLCQRGEELAINPADATSENDREELTRSPMLSGLRHCGRLKLPSLPPSLIQECVSCLAVDQPTWSSRRLLRSTIFRRGLRHAFSGGFCEQSYTTSTSPSSRSSTLLPAGLAVRNVMTEGTSAKQVQESSTMTKATLEHRTDFFQASKQVNQDHILIVLNYSLPDFVPRIWEQSECLLNLLLLGYFSRIGFDQIKCFDHSNHPCKLFGMPLKRTSDPRCILAILRALVNTHQCPS
jgi:hypothetical protein